MVRRSSATTYFYTGSNVRTSRRAIPLDAAHLKTWTSELVQKAIEALVGVQWRREDEGETEHRPTGTINDLASDVLSVVDVKKRQWDVPVTVSTRPGRTPGPTAGANHIQNPDPLRDGPAKSINLWLNGRWSPYELQAEKWEVVKQTQSMLLHEVTHAMDYLDKVESALRGDQGDAYYNQPHEVRAYARQIIDDVLKAYKVLLLQSRRQPAGYKLPTGHVLIEQLLDSSPTWVSVGQHFNDKNEKLIRQMVVRELQDANPDRQLAARVVSRHLGVK